MGHTFSALSIEKTERRVYGYIWLSDVRSLRRECGGIAKFIFKKYPVHTLQFRKIQSLVQRLHTFIRLLKTYYEPKLLSEI